MRFAGQGRRTRRARGVSSQDSPVWMCTPPVVLGFRPVTNMSSVPSVLSVSGLKQTVTNPSAVGYRLSLEDEITASRQRADAMSAAMRAEAARAEAEVESFMVGRAATVGDGGGSALALSALLSSLIDCASWRIMKRHETEGP